MLQKCRNFPMHIVTTIIIIIVIVIIFFTLTFNDFYIKQSQLTSTHQKHNSLIQLQFVKLKKF